VEARVEPLTGNLPAISWRWDPETDILAGSFKVVPRTSGMTGTIELADDEGSIALMDVDGGVVRGLDIVVWPEVTTVAQLAPPEVSREGRLIIPSRRAPAGVDAMELDTTLSVSTNSTETLFHLRIGIRRPVEPVRVADHLIVELDARRRLAGFWLQDVPPFVPMEE
jgi:hypothetical protein